MDKKRKIKLVIVIAVWILLIVLVGYVVATYMRLNSPDVNLSDYYSASFYGQDGESRIVFNTDATRAYVQTPEHSGLYAVSCIENMFTLTSESDAEDVQNYIIIDRDFAFGQMQYWLCVTEGI